MTSEIAISGSAPVVASSAAPRVAAPRPAPASTAPAQTAGTGTPAEAAAQVGQHLQQARPELKLKVDAESGRTVFQVIQQGTGQVVMQVPSEEILGMSRRLREAEGLAGTSGTLVDKQG
jgi:flagellar protein FlaG